MKTPLVLTIVILVAGVLLGVREHRNLAALQEKHRLVVEEAAALGISVDSSKPFVPTKASKRPREDNTRKAKEFADRLVVFAKEMKEIQKSGNQPDENARKRMMEVMDGLLSLNGGELKALIAELKDRQDMDNEMRQGLLMFSIMMLAQQHPEAALALFTESSDLLGDNPMSKHALTAALSQWAKDQPLEALKWIKDNADKHPDLVTDDTKTAVIVGAARSDFGLAFQLIGELKLSTDSSAGVVSQIAQAAATPEQRTEFLKALRKEAENSADKAEGEKLLSTGVRSMFSQLAATGYDQTMDWLKSASLSAEETSNMAEGLSYYQTKADTGKWLDWLSTQPENEKHTDNVTRNLVRNWTEKDYKAAGEWLAQAPAGPTKEAATKSYLETVAPYEPDVAAQWAGTLPADKQQSELRNIYEALKRKDKNAAEDFAARHGVDVKR